MILGQYDTLGVYGAGGVSNTAPIANAGTDQANITAGATVTLSGVGSSDADSDTLTYLWTPPAGITLSSNTAQSPTFTAPTTGSNQTLTFSLVVNDGTVNSAADTVNVGILAEVVTPTNTAPTIAAISNQSVSAGQSVTVTAIGSDVDSDALTYTFRQVSGTSVTLTQTANTVSFTAPSDSNTHSVVIGVIANDGAENSAEVTTTISVAAISDQMSIYYSPDAILIIR